MNHWNYDIQGICLTFYMPQELDHHVAGELREVMERLISSYQIREIIMDFSETEFMDSAGVGMIIGRSKTLQYYGGKVLASNLSPQMKKIVRAAGLHRLIQVEEGA